VLEKSSDACIQQNRFNPPRPRRGLSQGEPPGPLAAQARNQPKRCVEPVAAARAEAGQGRSERSGLLIHTTHQARFWCWDKQPTSRGEQNSTLPPR